MRTRLRRPTSETGRSLEWRTQRYRPMARRCTSSSKTRNGILQLNTTWKNSLETCVSDGGDLGESHLIKEPRGGSLRLALHFFFVGMPQAVFKNHQFLEHWTPQSGARQLNGLERLGEGLRLGVFGTLLKGAMHTADRDAKLL